MTTALPQTNGKPRDARQAAIGYISLRYSPIPIPLGTKKAITENWPNLRISSDNLDEFFPEMQRQNIGLLLGEPSGGLIDVDLDCPEAVRAADLLLPKTPRVSGRKSSPRSHRWYSCPTPPETTAFQATAADMIVELRSTGVQTVVPPSIHPDGEDYIWYAEGMPAVVSGAELVKAVARVAAAALIAKNWPKKGRHNAALALAGGLRRADWPVEDTVALVEAVCGVARDEETTDRIRAVTDTFDPNRAVEKQTGWPALTDILGEPVVKKVTEWLGVSARPKAAPAVLRPVRVLPEYKKFPVDTLPGPTGAYVREVAAATRTDSAFCALPALATMAGAIGNSRRLQIKRSWYEPSVVWSVVVAESGAVKSPPVELAVKPAADISATLYENWKEKEHEYKEELARWNAATKKNRGVKPAPPTCRQLLAENVTVEALVELLADNSHGMMIYRDELDGWFNSFGLYKAKGNAAADVPHWLSFHGARATRCNRRTGDRKVLFAPRTALSITGTIQPGTLSRSLTRAFFDCGLPARLLFAMPPKVKKVWSDADVSDLVERAYADLITKLYALDFATGPNGRPAPVLLQFAPEAKTQFIRFYGDWADKQFSADADLASAFAKLEGYAARFAMIHHCATLAASGCDDPLDRSPVTKDSLDVGITLARWFAGETERVYQMLGHSEVESAVNGLFTWVKGRNGRATVRDLQNSNSRKYPTKTDAEAALQSLVTAELAHWEKRPSSKQGGHPTYALVLDPLPTADTTDTTSAHAGDDVGVNPTGVADTTAGPSDTTPTNPSGKPGCVGSVGLSDGVSGEISDGGSDGPDGFPPDEVVSDGVAVVSGGAEFDLQYTVIDRPAALAMVLAALDETVLVGLDCETTGLDPRRDRVRLLSLDLDTCDGGRHSFLLDVFGLTADELIPLYQMLADKELIGHNLYFDLAFLARLDFTPRARCHDTMLMARLLAAGTREPCDLAAVVQRELAKPLNKAHQTADWSGMLSAAQFDYAARDVAVLLPLFRALRDRISAADLTTALDIEERALPAMVWTGAAGVPFDAAAWAALASRTETTAERIRDELDRMAAGSGEAGLFGRTINWNSPDQVRNALADVGVNLDSTDDDVGVQFEPLRRFRCGHFGAFWQKHLLPKGFKDLSDEKLLPKYIEKFADVKLKLSIPTDVEEMAGVRMKARGQGCNVQLQPDKLYLSWNRTNPVEPRYANIKEQFVALFGNLDEFVTTGELGLVPESIRPNLWEIQYVNQIPPGNLWREPRDWHRVLPAFFNDTDPSADGVKYATYNGEWHFEIEPKKGRVHVRGAKMVMNQSTVPTLYFSLVARGEIGEHGSPDYLSGRDLGHKACVRLFFKLTSDAAHQEWGLKR